MTCLRCVWRCFWFDVCFCGFFYSFVFFFAHDRVSVSCIGWHVACFVLTWLWPAFFAVFLFGHISFPGPTSDQSFVPHTRVCSPSLCTHPFARDTGYFCPVIWILYEFPRACYAFSSIHVFGDYPSMAFYRLFSVGLTAILFFQAHLGQ